jgi:hypothetical protein
MINYSFNYSVLGCHPELVEGLPDYSAFSSSWVIGCLVRSKGAGTTFKQNNNNNQRKSNSRFHSHQILFFKTTNCFIENQ